jgi:hypothetical protein
MDAVCGKNFPGTERYVLAYVEFVGSPFRDRLCGGRAPVSGVKGGEVKMKIRYGLGVVLGILSVTSVALTGCRVDTHKDGDHEDVKIATPFGGMSVKTNDSAVQANVGLALYPGATLVKKLHTDSDGKSHEEGAADINMSFGSFHLGVKALSYQTPDAPDKVIAFYRKDLARYGQVIFCKADHAEGTPTVTQDGLTCDKKGYGKNNVHVNGDEEGSEGELKAGSKLHQHIVAIDAQGSGTKFGLVMLDLPGHMGIEDDDSRQ